MRRVWGVLVVLLVLAGCTTERVGGRPDRTEAPKGPFDLAVPIELARVSPTETPTDLPDPEGVTLFLDEPFLTVTRLEHAEVQSQQGNWGLRIELTQDDGEVFGEWTEAHIGERVAMVVDGEIASAPQISQAIPGGEVVISGRYTQTEARALLNKITGR